VATIAPEREETRIGAGLDGFYGYCARVGLDLAPFQRKIARAFFGEQRELLILIPRGNGKSRLIGALAVHHLLTHPAPRVYVAASSRDQARIVFEYSRDDAIALDTSDLIVRHLELRVPTGYLRVLASDAPKLHGIHPTLAVIDEIHTFKDNAVYEALRSGLTEHSKLIVITTAGQGADTPLGQMRARALGQPTVSRRGALTDARGPRMRMLEWSVPEERELDDIRAAKMANPAPWISRAHLREQREALPELAFRRYHLNQWTARIGSWLSGGGLASLCTAGSGAAS
jgi:phage terminase large subunit-like protein